MVGYKTVGRGRSPHGAGSNSSRVDWPSARATPAGTTATAPCATAPRATTVPVRDSAVGGIDFGPLEQWIGFNLRMAQDASFQAFSRLSQEIGVRPGRFATLTLIGKNPGISQTALSRANSRDKSTLTPLIADLVRRGLIRRTRMRGDRRSYRLSLTQAGEQVLAQLTACARGPAAARRGDRRARARAIPADAAETGGGNVGWLARARRPGCGTPSIPRVTQPTKFSSPARESVDHVLRDRLRLDLVRIVRILADPHPRLEALDRRRRR